MKLPPSDWVQGADMEALQLLLVVTDDVVDVAAEAVALDDGLADAVSDGEKEAVRGHRKNQQVCCLRETRTASEYKGATMTHRKGRRRRR